MVLSREQSEGVGALVRRSIGGSRLKNFDPFLLLDEFDVATTAGFPDHPHRWEAQSLLSFSLLIVFSPSCHSVECAFFVVRSSHEANNKQGLPVFCPLILHHCLECAYGHTSLQQCLLVLWHHRSLYYGIIAVYGSLLTSRYPKRDRPQQLRHTRILLL